MPHYSGHRPPPAEPIKTGWELFTDPHFVVTCLSLVFSVSVFFYYLYQLLCGAGDDRRDVSSNAERQKLKQLDGIAAKAKADVDRLTAARRALDDRIAKVAEQGAAASVVKAGDSPAAAAPAKTKAKSPSPKKKTGSTTPSPTRPAANEAPAAAPAADAAAATSLAKPAQQLRQRKVPK